MQWPAPSPTGWAGIDYANTRRPLENEPIKAVWRAVHDGRAAVRYFRQSVEEENNPSGNRLVRPDFHMAASPPERLRPPFGCALHHAYVDDWESEVRPMNGTGIPESQTSG